MATTLSPTPALTAADRCDRCGASASVRVILRVGGELLFCGHHAREHMTVLAAQDAYIDDQSDRLSGADEGPNS